VTGVGYGHSIFIDCTTSAENQDAEACAQRLYQTLLAALQLDTTLPADAPCFPAGKVANVTTDAASVMQAMVREMRQYKLCTGITWNSCSCHVSNLFLLDEVEMSSQVKFCVTSSRAIVEAFGVGNVHKLLTKYEYLQEFFSMNKYLPGFQSTNLHSIASAFVDHHIFGCISTCLGTAQNISQFTKSYPQQVFDPYHECFTFRYTKDERV
jgi:hypothetical protein